MNLKNIKTVPFVMVIAATILSGAQSFACADSPRIDGVVTDQSGRPLPGAIVHVSWQGADKPSVYGDVFTTTCDPRGRFSISGDKYFAICANLQPSHIFVEPPDTGRWKISDFDARLPAYNGLFDDLKLRRYARVIGCKSARTGDTTNVGLVVDSGLLAISILNSNGRALTNTQVDVEPVDDDIEINTPLLTRFEGRTDASGRIEIELPSSSNCYWVRVPGVGYASTGEVTVADGQCSRISLPRLAPFGTISGYLPASDTVGKGRMTMSVFDRDLFWADVAPVNIGANGYYSITGLAAGNTNLDVRSGSRPVDTVRAVALPGQITHPLPTEMRDENAMLPWPEAPKRLKLSGTVVDTHGRTIEGADVYVVGHSNSGMEVGFLQMGERCLATKTDSTGAFAFGTTSGNFDAGADFYAVQSGAPPAYASIAAPTMRDAVNGVETYAPVRLTVPSQSGTLNIHLIGASGPVQGLRVRVTRLDLCLTDWAYQPQPEEAAAKAVRDSIEPETLVGTDGDADFANLAPGAYKVEVSSKNSQPGQPTYWTELAVRTNVPVQESRSTTLAIAVPSSPPPREWDAANAAREQQPPPIEAHAVEVHLLGTDGRPTEGVVTIGEDYRLVAIGATDGHGIARFPGVPIGAWQITAISPKSAGPTRYGPALPNVLPHDPARRNPVFDVVTADSAALRGKPVILREQIPAYITGRICASLPKHLAALTVTVDKSSTVTELGATLDLDPDTGAYFYGPLAPGRTALDINRPYDDTWSWNSACVSVTNMSLGAGELRHIDLKQTESDADFAQESLKNLDLSELTVYLPDGATPAVGALLYGQSRGNDQPTYRAITDANGHPVRIARDENYGFDYAMAERTVVVVWMPGRFGPVAFSLPAAHLPTSLILPAARDVRGAVAMRGKPAVDQLGDIQLVAVCTDPPAIGSLCAVRAPLDADGTFCLRGLLPGRSYQVRAVLDYKPISANVTLSANSNMPIAIEITPPADWDKLPVD